MVFRVLAAAAALVGPCLLAMAGAHAAPTHRIDVRVAGPLALVEVERPLVFGADVDRPPSDEVVVDLDLPDGARLGGVETVPPGRRAARPAVSPEGKAAATIYRDHLLVRGWRGARVPLDEGIDVRLRAIAPGLGERERGRQWTLRYRFAVPLTCSAGRLLVRMPASLDPDPAPADVRLSAVAPAGAPGFESLVIGDTPVPVTAGQRRIAGRVRLSVRRPWEIQLGPRRRANEPFVAAAWGPGRRGASGTLAVGLCRPPAVASAPTPDQVVLIVDRSRSVGPGGAAGARELARALVMALPPALRFNAVLFDRQARTLFPTARTATLEAMTALEEAIGGALRNGTDLAAALKVAGALTSAAVAGRTWWVVITDGALAERQTTTMIEAALAGVSAAAVDAAVLVLRAAGEDRLHPAARAPLAAIPGRLGGILREISPADLSTVVGEVLSALPGPGDLFDVRATWTGSERGLPIGAWVPQGEGATALAPVAAPAAARVVVTGAAAGGKVRVSFRPEALSPVWATEIAGGPTVARVFTDRELGLLVEPSPKAAPSEEPPPRGQLDRQVVRNALSLAFLPRARACYVSRPVRSAQDRDLRGRVRLQLHLERGEMLDAVVASSTLERPEIEACLRDAAFELEVPRALRNDAAVVAVLNLVFQPRTPSAPPRQAPTAGDEIDLLVGPPSGVDPLDVLGQRDEGSRTGERDAETR